MTSKLNLEDVGSCPTVIVSLPKESNLEIKSSQEMENCISLNSFDKLNKKLFFSRQHAILCVLYITCLLRGVVRSLHAPFFPEVAEAKGASATEYGFVFSIVELTALLISPTLGAKIKSIGAGRMCIGGIFVASLCTMLFGILPSIESSKNAFIGSCLVVRCLESLGESAFFTAAYTIVAIEFPDTVATSFASLELLWGVGKMIGPALGGFLYELGGFSLPFYVMGGLLFIFALANCKVFPNAESNVNNSKGSSNEINDVAKTPTILNLMYIPVIAMTSCSILVAAASNGFLTTLLEPHLRRFKLSKAGVGSVFFLSAMAYTFTVPLSGNVCDRIKNPKLVTLFGSIIIILGLAFIGPLPFLPFDTNLWVACVGLIPAYIGIGAVYVSAFRILLTDAVDKGYSDDVSIRGLVSGLWKTMMSLGMLIGYTVGGVLDDLIGFRWGSLFVIGAELIFTVVLIIFLVKTRW